MRHRKAGRKLGRTSSHRKAMFRNLVVSLLRHDKIRTTVSKAKELRQYVEPVITVARKHAWSNYESTFAELQTALGALQPTSDEGKAALEVVNKSASAVQNRFPSGLGRLSKVLQKEAAADANTAVVLRARSAQMKRQHAIAQVKSTVADLEVLERLFGELAETLKERNGGYTRIIRDGHREGDNADMAYIMLVLEALEPKSADSAEDIQEPEENEDKEEGPQSEDVE